MLITGLDLLAIGELVPPGSFCDACLQRTLNSVASQVISAIVQAEFRERLRLANSDAREPLQIASVHFLLVAGTAPAVPGPASVLNFDRWTFLAGFLSSAPFHLVRDGYKGRAAFAQRDRVARVAADTHRRIERQFA